MKLKRKLNVLHDRFLQLYLVHLADLTQLYQILWRCVIVLFDSTEENNIFGTQTKQNYSRFKQSFLAYYLYMFTFYKISIVRSTIVQEVQVQNVNLIH
jgi:hypothetical protein